MQLPPKGKIEWNLNTIITLVGFSAGLVAWGATWGTFTSNVRSMETKITDSFAAQKEVNGRFDTRLFNVEEEARKLENLAYRVTVVEQNQASATQSMKELKDAVNNQAADIRIVREILEQLREAQGLPRRVK